MQIELPLTSDNIYPAKSHYHQLQVLNLLELQNKGKKA